jgi:hypothetical protein
LFGGEFNSGRMDKHAWRQRHTGINIKLTRTAEGFARLMLNFVILGDSVVTTKRGSSGSSLVAADRSGSGQASLRGGSTRTRPAHRETASCV